MTLNILWILHTSYLTVKKYNFSHTPPPPPMYFTQYLIFSLKKKNWNICPEGMLYIFFISKFCNGCSTHIPPFQKKLCQRISKHLGIEIKVMQIGIDNY